MPDEADRVLLVAARRGDNSAARALLAQIGPLLAAHARTILRDAALAEDAVQSALCRLFRLSVGQVKRIESPRAWLSQVVRREALMMVRSHKRAMHRLRRRARAEAAVLEAAPREEPADLDRLIASLPRRLAEVIVLKHVSNLTFDQIAAALSLNRNTAASRYRAAVARLQRAVAHEEAGLEPRSPAAHPRAHRGGSL